MNNRRLLWSLLVIGILAVLGLFVAIRSGDDQPPDHANRQPSIREWPKIKEVSTAEYATTLKILVRSRVRGTVLLPREPAEAETVAAKQPRDVGIVPPQVCGQCHAEHWIECQQTAHFRTSSEPTSGGIRGSFEPPRNRVKSFHPQAWLEVVAKPNGFYQQFHFDDAGRPFHHEARMDLVIGSGKLGQSFLHWVKDALHELPISHFSDRDCWDSSPGDDYPEGTVNFARPIIERCLDCHATWFERVPQTINRFVREDYVLGVTCSRCHGRGHEHVEHHQTHPNETAPVAIVNPANLRRDLANAVCAQCHSGEGRLVSTGFGYQPGEPLSDYLTLSQGKVHGSAADPHAANQMQRLEESQCFQKSDMSCFTCHDPHRNERGREDLFVGRCLKCHQRDDCGQRQLTGEAIDRLCIECHMPLVQDTDLRRPGQDSQPTPKMRDHRIQVWPTATKNVLQRLSQRPD